VSSTHKEDLLEVIHLAMEYNGRLPPAMRDMANERLMRLRARVEGGNEYDQLRRRVRQLEFALRSIGEAASGALYRNGEP
jgi:hypothetical protein